MSFYPETISDPQSGPTSREQWKAFYRTYRVLRRDFDYPNAQAHFQCLFWYDNRYWSWYWLCEYGNANGMDDSLHVPTNHLPKDLRRQLLKNTKERRMRRERDLFLKELWKAVQQHN